MANVETHVKFHENLFISHFLRTTSLYFELCLYKNYPSPLETPLNYHFNLNKATPRTERLPFWTITLRNHTHICVLRKRGRGEQTRVLSRLGNGQTILDDN